MPVPEACEWSLRPSRWQGYLDGAALLTTLGILAFQGLSDYLMVIIALLVSVWFWLRCSQPMRQRMGQWTGQWPERRIQRIGLDSLGWWLEIDGERQAVNWRSHSLKRSRLVVLRWSVWPWDALVLRADSFASEDEFRRFRSCLYGHL